MSQEKLLGLLLANFLLAGCVLQPGSNSTEGLPQKGPETKSDVQIVELLQDQTQTIQITSIKGIGKATLKPKQGVWPKKVILSMQLAGLEQLLIQSQAGQLSYSLSEKIHPKSAKNPSIKPIKILLPEALFTPTRDNSLQVQWVDFYR